MLAFSDTNYEVIINLLQSIELFCAYLFPTYGLLPTCADFGSVPFGINRSGRSKDLPVSSIHSSI